MINVSISTLLIVLVIFVLFSAFFSASEAALIALNKIRLRHLVENKKRGAQRVYNLVSRMDQLIATILVGDSLVNTVIAAIGTIIFSRFFGEGKGLILATIFVTITLVIFGELTPKILATNHPEGVSFFVRHIISFFIKVLEPVTHLLTAISNGLIRLLGGNPQHRSPLLTEEEMKMMITIGKEEGFYGDNERKMLERIFHFDEITLGDVMTPFERMTSVSINEETAELERVLLEEGHNRIPVYKDHPANIVGIIYVRDILYLFKNSSLIHLQDLISMPYFVEPRQKVAELLKDFLRKKIQIAIVRDPGTGKAIGLVTLEDLFEEIVGEIEEIDSKLVQ
ncbi:MAG: hypothetical protein COT00_00760 [Candidatus Omnitrophica bacterium CG07_land_8_20_14_0_80_50_8]|nr:MAG: hypothetical protein AUJ71_01485 [Candidatus Omnitrophica bacterium CG1_02_49_16]PIU40623.1 MAG: hypothetical protein COT00_00760 [Candidatus Omnitrophica bacterium CG07_land_8_20_14_0_80_50_8]